MSLQWRKTRQFRIVLLSMMLVHNAESVQLHGDRVVMTLAEFEAMQAEWRVFKLARQLQRPTQLDADAFIELWHSKHLATTKAAGSSPSPPPPKAQDKVTQTNSKSTRVSKYFRIFGQKTYFGPGNRNSQMKVKAATTSKSPLIE